MFQDNKTGKIFNAITENRIIAFNYTDPRGLKTTRIIKPSHVYVYQDGTTYVRGYCTLRGAVRTFCIQRIDALVIGDVTKPRSNVLYPTTWGLRKACACAVKNIDKFIQAGWSQRPQLILEPQRA